MMSSGSCVVDTYPRFVSAVQAEKPVSVQQWISCWAEHYMPHWPNLYDMVVANYADEGDDWREVARDMVFPGMNDKLPAMDGSYRNLKRIIPRVEKKVQAAFAFHEPACYVLYVGIGNGAGWVTKYNGSWAVLFGLEAIVDSGFEAPARLEGLVAHELGHVIHFTWREARGLPDGAGPWWQLYEEGFAQQCELTVMADDGWHMKDSYVDDDWLAWCQANRAWLAAEFLRVADQGSSVRPFFGSWYELRGRKQTGYFLGQQVISHLADKMALVDIALLNSGPELERALRHVLEEFAATSG